MLDAVTNYQKKKASALQVARNRVDKALLNQLLVANESSYGLIETCCRVPTVTIRSFGLADGLIQLLIGKDRQVLRIVDDLCYYLPAGFRIPVELRFTDNQIPIGRRIQVIDETGCERQ